MTRTHIIGAVQSYCANIAERDTGWTTDDAAQVAAFLNEDDDPYELFRLMDETMSTRRTSDGREWFYVMRQMRNTVGSGLLENLRAAS
jgi:hypothetical protein